MPSAFYGDPSQRAWSAGWASLSLICTLVGVMWVGLNWCLSMTETDLAWQVLLLNVVPSASARAAGEKHRQAPVLQQHLAPTWWNIAKNPPCMLCVYIWCVFPCTKLSKYFPILEKRQMLPSFSAATRPTRPTSPGLPPSFLSAQCSFCLAPSLSALAISPFHSLRKEKENLRIFLHPKPFSSSQSSLRRNNLPISYHLAAASFWLSLWQLRLLLLSVTALL